MTDDISPTDNTYLLDPESPDEMARLLNMDRFITRAMGGPLAMMWQFGYGFSVDGRTIDVSFMLPHLLRTAKYSAIQSFAYALEFSKGTEVWADSYHNYEEVNTPILSNCITRSTPFRTGRLAVSGNACNSLATLSTSASLCCPSKRLSSISSAGCRSR